MYGIGVLSDIDLFASSLPGLHSERRNMSQSVRENGISAKNTPVYVHHIKDRLDVQH